MNMTKKDFALTYLKNGISVFPTRGKKPLVAWEKYSRAKPTEQEVIDWWTKWPEADIAGATGAVSDLVVVDVDGGEVPKLPPTAVSETSPGHYQYFFKHPGFPVQNSVKVIAPNVDVRGDGGFVVLPPSRHFNKKTDKQDFTYIWSIPPKDADFADLPESILEKVKIKKPVSDVVQGVIEGERNNSAASMAGKLLKRFPAKEWESEAWPLLQAWNDKNNPPLSAQELRLVFDSILQREADNKEAGGESARRGVADILADITLSSGATLYLDQSSEPHITLPDRSVVGFPIKGLTFKRWLSGKYWSEYNKGFSGEQFLKAVNSLEGRAFHEGQSIELFNRVAKIGSVIYYDLGDDARVVKITGSSWEIIDNCPVKFRRFNHQRAQVEPIQGGKLSDVLKYINLKSDNDRLLLLTYLVAIIIPDIPRVVLVNIGDQGAAKSTALRILRSLIDPSLSELLSPPSDIVELSQASNHHFCLYLDNLSYLKDDLSDALCRLATGIGFTKRKLYTDDDDILFNQKVAVGITGINLVAQKADLLDRCLILQYERIPEDQRTDEDEFWQKFNADKPAILGALFDTLSQVLKILSDFKLSKKPRMADYAKYGAAAAIALGYSADQFLKAFSENISRQNQAAIESSPTAQVVLQFMSDQNFWSGSSSELHQELKVLVEKLNLQIGGSDGFPKSANWLWKRIMQVRPNLLERGISAQKEDTEANSVIKLTKTVQDAINTSITSSTPSETEALQPEAGSMEALQASSPLLDTPDASQTIDKLTVDEQLELGKSVFGEGTKWAKEAE